jgi:hypothetical protein
VTRLDDELIKKLATGSGRCYPYEGKAMAAEILEWRTKAAEAAKAAGNNPHPIYGGMP